MRLGAVGRSRAVEHGKPIPLKPEPGQTWEVDGFGWRGVSNVDVPNNALHLVGVRQALCLSSLVHDGAAVCLKSGTPLGPARQVINAVPHWSDRGERSTLSALVNPILGRRPVFEMGSLSPERLALNPPTSYRKRSWGLMRFAAEL
ncbi:MAG: hypothetical protein AAFQ82_26665, partial [Myxococcota bacterium]